MHSSLSIRVRYSLHICLTHIALSVAGFEMSPLRHQKASQYADDSGLTIARAGSQTWAFEFQVLGFAPTHRNLHQHLKSALLAGLADGPAFGARCLKRDPTRTAR